MSNPSLKITEIFLSIQGEAASVGFPTVFVRLTGCPLRCQYCDTEYAFYGGSKLPLEQIIQQVESHGVRHVCVTGGEPLAQRDCHRLLAALVDKGYQVSLETSGALSVEEVDPRISIVMDLKTPASAEVARNNYANIHHLAQKDQLKFVICDRRDFDWALFKLNEYQLFDKVGNIFFSPSYEQLPAPQLAQWILAEKLPVRLQIQLHKSLWGDQPGV